MITDVLAARAFLNVGQAAFLHSPHFAILLMPCLVVFDTLFFGDASTRAAVCLRRRLSLFRRLLRLLVQLSPLQRCPFPTPASLCFIRFLTFASFALCLNIPFCSLLAFVERSTVAAYENSTFVILDLCANTIELGLDYGWQCVAVRASIVIS